MSVRHCDYVVVGAGAAGCAVAGRLAEGALRKVVLVEAGGSDRHPLTSVPGTAFLASVSPKRNWNFQTEPVPGLGGRRMKWNQGRLVGGSSSINGMIYMRGHSREYEQWRQSGCEGWGLDGVLPFYRRSEDSARGAGPWHGTGGPIATRPSNTGLPICDAFLDAAGEAGFPVVDDLNADVQEGFGRFDINVRNGRRVSAARGYVDRVSRLSNFSLLTHALATRVIFRGRRAVGVEIARRGRRETVYASEQVVLCGGAINSPQLLMLSGVGPADHLASHGIEVVADLPEVGANLQNHPAYTLRFACSQPVTAYSYLRPATAAGIVLRYAFGAGGPLGESYVAQGGVFRTDPALEVSNAIAVMAPALVTRGGAGQSWRDLFPDRHGFSVSVSLGRPASRGTVRLNSADPGQHPAIQPNFLTERSDAVGLVGAVRTMRRIMRQPSIRGLVEADLSPGDVGDGDDELEAEIRSALGTYSHPSGTCRMGADPGAVLDPRLRVRGVDGLRVADASIMPAPLNACTHAPAIMIGEKAAAMIADDAGPAAGSAEYRRSPHETTDSAPSAKKP